MSAQNAVAPNGSAASEGSEKIPLLTPYRMGDFDLSMRMVYAPLTRCRAVKTIPQPAAVKYYTQRAHPGMLMLTEATQVSQAGQGYPDTPGIHSEEQVEAWKPIVSAVKQKGGVFFLQLWHVGRASHPDYQPGNQLPVGPSAVPITTDKVFSPSAGTLVDYPTPRELKREEIPGIVEEFRMGARNAIKAGFDGVEIHSANGYIIDQFLKDGINKRTDDYGGSIENRVRFCLEVVKAVSEEVGANRVGIRLSPFGGFLDAVDSDINALYMYLVAKLKETGILYVHFVEPRVGGNDDREHDKSWSLNPFRKLWGSRTFIAAGGYKRENGNAAIASGHTDLIAYGRSFLANPDLPERFAIDAPLNKYDRSTFYTPDQYVGYLDYPLLDGKTETASVAV